MRLRVAFAALLALVVLTVLVVLGFPDEFDAAISGHRFWLWAWRPITHAGDSLTLCLLAAVVLAVLLIRRRYLDAATVVVGASLTHVLMVVMKAAVGRDRPSSSYPGFSYPSGHAVHSATAAFLLACLVARFAWAFAAAAVLVGVSRVMLLAHWPTDVLGGWLLVLGVLPLVLTARDAVRRRRPRAAPSPGVPHSSDPPGPPSR